MLTIKEPLKLNSLNSMNIDVFSFAEKIMGNYSVFSLAIEGEDLLHMTMSPSDIYIAEGGRTQIYNRYTVNQNEVRIRAVNHFLNRIQYISSGKFTYQDEIYISMMLRKLGIKNVKEFAERIQGQQKKNELEIRLRTAYLENGRILRKAVHYFQDAEKQDAIIQDAGRFYLQNGIYGRLWTAELNNMVYAFQSSVQTHSREIADRELLLAEQIRMSDEIQLSQLKAYAAITEYPPMHQYFNLYELEIGSKRRRDKKEAAGQIAAAILANLADLVCRSRMQRVSGKNTLWLELRQSVCNSAKTVLDRIQRYHEKGSVSYRIDERYTKNINRIYGYENSLLKTFSVYRKNVDLYESAIKEAVSCYLQTETLEEQIAETVGIPDRPDTFYMDGWENDYEVILKLRDKAARYQALPAGVNLDAELRKEAEVALLPAVPVLETEPEKIYDNITKQFLMQYSQSVSLNDAGTGKEQEDSHLKNFLDRINEKNMEIQRKLSESHESEEIPSQIIIDRSAARKLSIRALENQEEVLAEVLTNAVPIERKANAEKDRMLELADEETRRIYERVLNYGFKNSGEHRTEEVTAINQMQFQELLSTEGNIGDGNRQYPQRFPANELWRDLLEKERIEDNSVLPEVQMEPNIEKTQKDLMEWVLKKSKLVQGNVPGESNRLSRGILEETNLLSEKNNRIAVSNMEEIRQETGRQTAILENAQNTIVEQVLKKAEFHQELSHEANREITLIHKDTVRRPDEELLGQMYQNGQKTTVKESIIETQIQRKTDTAPVTTETRQNIIINSEESVSRMVQQDIQTRINSISDQVYQKLERRLQNERRRRGY